MKIDVTELKIWMGFDFLVLSVETWVFEGQILPKKPMPVITIICFKGQKNHHFYPLHMYATVSVPDCISGLV